MMAVASGNPEMVNEILHYRPNVNTIDFAGQTALTFLFEFSFKENVTLAILKLLIAAGADVNHLDHNGTSAIFHVCGRSSEVVRQLKNTGSEPE